MTNTQQSTIRDLAKFVEKATTVSGGDYPSTIDVHFFRVNFTEAAADQATFEALLSGSEHGEFCDVSPERLAEGPGYMELGGWLGDQGLALRFIALGAHYGRWSVFTPAVLGVVGPKADELAGRGMVLVGPVSGG